MVSGHIPVCGSIRGDAQANTSARVCPGGAGPFLSPIKEENDCVGHFNDKTAIVTGGASGIGRALCDALSQRGARVTVADINREGAEQVALGISATGGLAQGTHLDVTRAESVQQLIDETVAERGKLDLMFNNAGVCMVGEVRDMDLEQWRHIMDVNLWGVIHGTTAAYQRMLEQGFGHIVNIASADGLMPFPMMTAYSTSKHAVIGLSTGLRAEAAGLGVKVSVVCPGLIRTGMQEALTVVTRLRDMEALRSEFLQSPMMMDAGQCARVILNGVERNRGIIMVTAFARVCWWLYRLHPALISPLNRAWVRTIRAHRSES
jgi:NAD(P)-dependent dehydrogenase (short-subunit alcohol dehydrogenase family)